MCAWRQSGVDHEAGAAERRCLGLLLEGLAINQVQVDPSLHRRLRSDILRDSIRLTERQSETDLLQTVASIVREFESYRTESEGAMEARQKEWRQLVAMLMAMLAERDQIDLSSQLWVDIALDLTAADAAEGIQQLRYKLLSVFQRSGSERIRSKAAQAEEQDRSMANDNAAGLRGGGAAIEHVRTMLSVQRPGFIALFRLSCLDVVGERFGPEGIQDCMMAVSAFLIENLRSEDAVYHWSENSLLAVCDRKVREEMLAAELGRILAQNRDFTLQVGHRSVMLRIPVELTLYPIALLSNAEDLHKLTIASSQSDRTFAARGKSH